MMANTALAGRVATVGTEVLRFVTSREFLVTTRAVRGARSDNRLRRFLGLFFLLVFPKNSVHFALPFVRGPGFFLASCITVGGYLAVGALLVC